MLDAWHTKSIKDKLRVWFMPTGWRPADVEQTYPVFTIARMSDLKKYNPFYSKWFTAFSVVHMSVIFGLLCFLFFRFGEIEKSEALLNGVFLLLAIFGFTSLLDKKQYGLISMLAVAVLVVVYCVSQRDWFGINGFVPAGSVAIAFYFSVTAIAALWFYKNELSKNSTQTT
jgi:alkylglycerol monooxygenase